MLSTSVMSFSRYFAFSSARAIFTVALLSEATGGRFSINLEAVLNSPGPELFEKICFAISSFFFCSLEVIDFFSADSFMSSELCCSDKSSETLSETSASMSAMSSLIISAKACISSAVGSPFSFFASFTKLAHSIANGQQGVISKWRVWLWNFSIIAINFATRSAPRKSFTAFIKSVASASSKDPATIRA